MLPVIFIILCIPRPPTTSPPYPGFCFKSNFVDSYNIVLLI